MLNVYKYHIEPDKLVQLGTQAQLREVVDYVRPILVLYAYQFNDDPDSNEVVELKDESVDADEDRFVLRFTRKNNEPFKRIQLHILQTNDNVALHGRSANIDSPKKFIKHINAFIHGVFDDDAIEDFIDDLLHF